MGGNEEAVPFGDVVFTIIFGIGRFLLMLVPAAIAGYMVYDLFLIGQLGLFKQAFSIFTCIELFFWAVAIALWACGAIACVFYGIFGSEI